MGRVIPYPSDAPPIMLSAATVMLLLSSLSAPIIKPLHLVRLVTNISGTSRKVNFGILGFCVEAISGIKGSDASTSEVCSKIQLGYIIDSTVTSALHAPGLQVALSKTHTTALVLHPISTLLTALAFLVSLAVYMTRRNRGSESSMGVTTLTVVLTFGIIAMLFVLLTVIVDVTVITTLRARVREVNLSRANIQLKWDNAFLLTALTLVAHLCNCILLWDLRKKAKITRKSRKSGF